MCIALEWASLVSNIKFNSSKLKNNDVLHRLANSLFFFFCIFSLWPGLTMLWPRLWPMAPLTWGWPLLALMCKKYESRKSIFMSFTRVRCMSVLGVGPSYDIKHEGCKKNLLAGERRVNAYDIKYKVCE